MTTEEKNQDADNIDLIRILFFLWVKKYWLFFGVIVTTSVGIYIAMTSEPEFYSEAIITPKIPRNAGPDLSALGRFGGLVTSKMGSSSQDHKRMVYTVRGRELAIKVLKRDSLIHRIYPDISDSLSSTWFDEKPMENPVLKKCIEGLRNGIISAALDKNDNVINVGARTNNAHLSRDIVSTYLKELNNKIRSDAVSESKINQQYLENQLKNTLNPNIRERIQNMIAAEIENSMLMVNQSIVIIEHPMVPIQKTKPQKKKIVISFFVLGIVLSIALIFLLNAGKLIRVEFRKRKNELFK